jgi:hypothetical protein
VRSRLGWVGLPGGRARGSGASSSVLETPSPRSIWTTLRSALVPGRPRERSSTSPIAAMSSTFKTSARLQAVSRTPSGTTAARSSSVLGTEVQGIPSTTARSEGWSATGRWMRIPRLDRALRFGTVTSIGPPPTLSSSCRAVEARCESSAPSPQASTAAIHRPCFGRSGRPRAKTPRCRVWSRPAVSLASIPLAPNPSSLSCARVSTPCWRPASAMIRASRCRQTVRWLSLRVMYTQTRPAVEVGRVGRRGAWVQGGALGVTGGAHDAPRLGRPVTDAGRSTARPCPPPSERWVGGPSKAVDRGYLYR